MNEKKCSFTSWLFWGSSILQVQGWEPKQLWKLLLSFGQCCTSYKCQPPALQNVSVWIWKGQRSQPIGQRMKILYLCQPLVFQIVSVHWSEEGCIGSYIPKVQHCPRTGVRCTPRPDELGGYQPTRHAVRHQMTPDGTPDGVPGEAIWGSVHCMVTPGAPDVTPNGKVRTLETSCTRMLTT